MNEPLTMDDMMRGGLDAIVATWQGRYPCSERADGMHEGARCACGSEYETPAEVAYRARLPYRLRYLGDPILNERCAPVDSRDGIPPGLLDAMRDAMGAHSKLRSLPDRRAGLGLAAPQVGALVRVILVRIANDPIATVMINPLITARSRETSHVPEGCLSIPGFQTNIERNNKITVTYLDEAFLPHTLHLGSLSAQVVQHEVDHLYGRMITDGLSRQLRRQAERAVAKASE